MASMRASSGKVLTAGGVNPRLSRKVLRTCRWVRRHARGAARVPAVHDPTFTGGGSVLGIIGWLGSVGVVGWLGSPGLLGSPGSLGLPGFLPGLEPSPFMMLPE